VTGLLKQPNELLAKFSPAIDDQDIRRAGTPFRTEAGRRQERRTNAVRRGRSTVRVELAWFRS
jgi:hypothetical protein